MSGLSEQEQLRRDSMQELVRLGIDPYPADVFEVNVTAADILANYERDKTSYKNISIAGRIMSRRIMGNASFAELQDASGRIQVYFRRDDLCPDEDKTLYNIVFKKLIDIGDIIGVTGYVFTTQVGEISIHVTGFKMLSKSLRPLPVVKIDAEGTAHDVVTDPEFRYRQRYADLIINQDVREVFRKRTKIIQSLRNTFNEQGYLEVETPILQAIPGGAAARPFITHHNALDMPLYLRIANELYLKRLIVGGYDGVYEFAKDFRNEGMDRTHNPEFTVMEIYVAYKDYNWMMNFTEEMVTGLGGERQDVQQGQRRRRDHRQPQADHHELWQPQQVFRLQFGHAAASHDHGQRHRAFAYDVQCSQQRLPQIAAETALPGVPTGHLHQPQCQDGRQDGAHRYADQAPQRAPVDPAPRQCHHPQRPQGDLAADRRKHQQRNALRAPVYQHQRHRQKDIIVDRALEAERPALAFAAERHQPGRHRTEAEAGQHDHCGARRQGPVGGQARERKGLHQRGVDQGRVEDIGDQQRNLSRAGGVEQAAAAGKHAHEDHRGDGQEPHKNNLHEFLSAC